LKSVCFLYKNLRGMGDFSLDRKKQNIGDQDKF
jgi:hypothetical protein